MYLLKYQKQKAPLEKSQYLILSFLCLRNIECGMKSKKGLYGELWHDSNRLFVKADGNPMNPSSVSKWFVKYVEEIGLPVINFHGLRHTNATLLISQNIDVAVVAARLGHAQISTTFNFYVHPIISHNRNAGNVLQSLLMPTSLNS